MAQNEIKTETIGELFVRRMDDLELTTAQVASALSFTTPNVVSMIRSGRLRLPVNRVILASKLLRADPVYVLRLLAAEMKEASGDDRLMEVVTIGMEQEPLTAGEWEMVQLYRQFTHGREVLLSSDEFLPEMNAVTAALEAVQRKVEKNIHRYAELKKKSRRGPQPGFARKRKSINLTGNAADAPAEPAITPEEALQKKLDEEAAELKALARAKQS